MTTDTPVLEITRGADTVLLFESAYDLTGLSFRASLLTGLNRKQVAVCSVGNGKLTLIDSGFSIHFTESETALLGELAYIAIELSGAGGETEDLLPVRVIPNYVHA